MESTRNKRPRIRAVPGENSRLIIIAAAFLVFSAALSYFLPERLAPYSQRLTPLSAAFIAATGVLLFFGRKRRGLYFASVLALQIAIYLFYSRLGADLFPMIASLLILLAAIGWRFNIVFGFLPEGFKLPLINLVSAALTLLCTPTVLRAFAFPISISKMSPLKSYGYALVALLPFISLLLINLSMKPQNAEGPDGPPRNVRSVPKGGFLFVIAACILLAGGIADFHATLTSAYNVSALMLSLPLLAAGILIVLSKRNDKRYLAGAVCLMLSVALSFFRVNSFNRYEFWTFSIPLLLMFISAIGVLRNTAPRFLKLVRSPILNILAALLLLANIAMTITGTLDRNAAAVQTRDEAFMKAATVAGDAASNANYYLKLSEAASNEFDEAVDVFYAALELAMPYVSEDSVANIKISVETAARDVLEAELNVTSPKREFENALRAFNAVISELSEEAAAEFAKIANAPPKLSSSSKTPGETSAPAASASSTPAASPTQEDIDSGIVDPVDAANDARRAVFSAEADARSAASRAERASNDAAKALASAEEDVSAAAAAAAAATVLWHTLLLSLLPSAGLVLLNLSLEGRVLESKGIIAALAAFCRRVFRWFYRDVGGKLKALAKIQGVICAVMAFLSALAAAVGLCGFIVSHFFAGIGRGYLPVLAAGCAGIVSAFIIALPTWLLYAYGQITSDLREVKGKRENPDDLPEL